MSTRFSKTQIATVGALIVMGVFNPASVAILEDYFKLVYTGLFVVASAWVVVFILVKALTPEKVVVPKKKAGKRDGLKYETT